MRMAPLGSLRQAIQWSRQLRAAYYVVYRRSPAALGRLSTVDWRRPDRRWTVSDLVCRGDL